MNWDSCSCCFAVVSLFSYAPSSLCTFLCPPCFMWAFCSRNFLLHVCIMPGTDELWPLRRTLQLSHLAVVVQCTPSPDLPEHAELTAASPLNHLKLDIVCVCVKFHVPQGKHNMKQFNDLTRTFSVDKFSVTLHSAEAAHHIPLV